MPIFPWTYQIEEWTADHMRPAELMCGANNLWVAIAAYEAAVKQRPDRVIYLRNGARVVRCSKKLGAGRAEN